MISYLSLYKARKWQKNLKAFTDSEFYYNICKNKELKIVDRKKIIEKNDELLEAVVLYHETKDSKSLEIINEILKIS